MVTDAVVLVGPAEDSVVIRVVAVILFVVEDAVEVEVLVWVEDVVVSVTEAVDAVVTDVVI